MNNEETKYCKHCGEKMPKEDVFCTKCEKEVEEPKSDSIIINNNVSASSSSNTNTTTILGISGRLMRPKNKWIALLLCICTICGHKFYEEEPVLGIIYLCTFGLFGIGWVKDIITLIKKPNPYYI